MSGVLKKSYSTFFPKTWSNQKIVNETNYAYGNMMSTGKAGTYIGRASSGLEIEIRVKNSKIDTAYPIYQGGN
ncbi:EndoU domain-containing protein [Lactovum odontotermitis]